MQVKFMFALSLLIITAGCGNKKSSSTVSRYSSPVISCNPAYGNNCGNQGTNGLNSQLYQFPVDVDAMRKLFEAAPFPGSVGPKDILNFYSPSQGGLELNFYFNGRLLFGPDKKDLVRYEFVNYQSNDVILNKYYPLKANPNKIRDTIYRSKEDIISEVFDSGLGTRVEAFKVCLQTNEKGSLQGVLVRRITRQGFNGGQITSQIVAILQGPMAINPVYRESYNPYTHVWKYDLLTSAQIGGKALTVKIDQSNYQQQNLPIVGCSY